jgi:hypothetical protein
MHAIDKKVKIQIYFSDPGSVFAYLFETRFARGKRQTTAHK